MKAFQWRLPVALILAAVSVAGVGATQDGDADGDGVPDVRDRCPRTLANTVVDQFGCSVVQLSLGGHRMVMLDIAAAHDDAEQWLAPHRELDDAAQKVHDARPRFEAASMSLERGMFCAAKASFADGRRLLRAAASQLDSLIPDLIPTLTLRSTRTDGSVGDADEQEAKVSELQIAQSLTHAAADTADAGTWAMEEPCGKVAASRVSFQGHVASVDASSSLARLTDGTAVVVPGHLQDIDAYVGGDVSGTGARLTDGTIWPDSMSEVGTGINLGNLVPLPCLALRIAPYQDFDWSLQPPVLHPLNGYDRDGSVWLEAKMRFATQNVCPVDPGTTPQISFTKRTLKIEIEYKDPNDGLTKKHTVATALEPGDSPVGFPTWMASILNAQNRKIIYTERTQNCIFGLNTINCSAPTPVTSFTKPAVMLSWGAFCDAEYQDDTFTLEDDDMTSFQTTKVLSIDTAPWLSQAAVQTQFFDALGYSVVGNVSSKPNVVTIGQGQNFAIYNEDFDATEFNTGADRRSGLMWPRVKGTASGGNPFWYSCQLPKIVRDAVSICNAASEHAYYRIPFSPGFWTITQGNNQPFTHNGNQAFAFDFAAGSGTSIKAARGGKVTTVIESNSANCYPNGGCDPNKLVIKHEDGSYGIYFHMLMNGIDVSVGQTVHRGDHVADVGNTGYSTGPHLHYHVKEVPGGVTVQHRYELYRWLQEGLIFTECYIPQTGETVFSNNS